VTDRDRNALWILLAGLALIYGGAYMSASWWSRLFSPNKGGVAVIGKTTTPADGDKMILQQLTKSGADLAQQREVLHYLYVPTQEASHRAASKLREEGYEVTEKPSADAANNPHNPWLVLARKVTVVNSQNVQEMRVAFEGLAKETNGDYDGWEAPAKP
jgi:Regulator of ribonuclease activity B